MPALFDVVVFVMAAISTMTMIIAVHFVVMPIFITPMVVVMHADGNTIRTQDYGIRHGARREEGNAKGYKK